MLRKPLLKLVTFPVGTTTATQATILPVADFDSIVVKAYGTLTGSSPTQDIVLQTSDDGGTTMYDVLRLAQITGSVTNANALWGFIPCASADAKYIGSAAANGLSVGTVSGLPLLDRYVYLSNTAGGTVGTCTLTVTLYAASESGIH